ncbi:MAG: response regulator transcription factor [Dehalococcoidia bacterium]
MKPLRVLIAEDHAVVREGTRDILDREEGITVVGEAADGQEAADLAAALQPDIVVLDLRLPVLSGIEAARRIRKLAPSTRILVLSAYDDEDYVLAAMEAGASGYLLKTAHSEEVIGAIYAISRGEVVLQQSVASMLWKARTPAHAQHQRDLDEPTEREMQVLRLAARGLRNKEIARSLQVSVRTVEGHLSHLFNKLGVTSRTEAIVLGAARGWYAIDGHERHPPEGRGQP